MRAIALLPVIAVGCGLPSIYAKKPPASVEDDAVVRAWVEEIREQGEAGDWLLTRNYAFAGDVIAGVSLGESLSHAALYDKDRDMVIEATSPRVQAVPLENFVRRYRRVILARPNWLGAEEQNRSVDRARALVGRPYDWSGLVGIDDDDKYYCSEFVIDVTNVDGTVRKPLLVTPAALLAVTHVIFDGGIRDEQRTRKWARSYWQAQEAARAMVVRTSSRVGAGPLVMD